MTLITGFSEGIDIRDPSTVTELKRIAVEHGKVIPVFSLNCS